MFSEDRNLVSDLIFLLYSVRNQTVEKSDTLVGNVM